MLKHHWSCIMIWIACFFMSPVFTKGKEIIGNTTSFNIEILRPSTNDDTDVGSVKSNTTNTSVDITVSEIPVEGPFNVLRSLHKHQRHSVDMFIVEGEVCERTETFLDLLDVPSTCHKQFSPVPPLMTSCNRLDMCPSQPPPDACDVFGNFGVDTIVNMLPDLLPLLKWNLAFIFHDLGMEEIIMHLSDKLSSVGIKLVTNVIHEDLSDYYLHDLLSSIYQETEADNRNFLLLCQKGCVNRILKLVSIFDHRNSNKTAIWKFSKWLVYGDRMDPQLITDLQVNNVAAITIPMLIPRGNSSITESDIAERLDSGHKMCVEGNAETPMKNDSIGRQIIQLLENNGGCWRGHIDTLLYKTNGRVFNHVGTFDLHGHITLKHNVFPNSNFGFNGRKLIIGTNTMFPFIIKSNSTISGFDGLCIDLLKQIAFSLNFTYEIRKPADKEWGRFINGSWTGLILGLQTREMDLVVAPLTVSIARESVMDFTVPFYFDHAVGVFKMPDPSRNKWLKLIRPFKGMVLACLGISLVVAAILLCIMESVNISLRSRRKTSARNVFQESIWYLYGALLAHGGSHQPHSESGRILVGFWWLFCIVIAASYSGTLIAFLTVNKEIPPFETLTEIAEQTEYNWGTIGGSSWVTYFEDTPTYEAGKLWEGMQRFSKEDPDILSAEPDVQKKKVAGGAYVFFSDSERLTLWTSQICDMALTKETFYPFTYALGLPKKSPYADVISETMLTIDQSGLFLTWKRKWWPRENMCLDERMTNARAIALDDLQSAFYLIGIGIVLASIILALEKLVILGCCDIQRTKHNV